MTDHYVRRDEDRSTSDTLMMLEAYRRSEIARLLLLKPPARKTCHKRGRSGLRTRATRERVLRGLSQTDLAKAADVSREALSKYERNEIVPSVHVAARIAEKLEVTLDYLIGNAHELAVDKQTLKRIREIEGLDNSTRSTLFTIIDTFLRDAKVRKAYA